MFNNLTPKNSPEVDDIFAGVENDAPAVSTSQPMAPRVAPAPIASSGMPTRPAAPVMPMANLGQMPNSGMSEETKGKMAKLIKTLIVTVIIMGLVLIGSYVIYKQFLVPMLGSKQATPVVPTNNQVNTPVVNTPVVNAPVVTTSAPTQIPGFVTSSPEVVPTTTIPGAISTSTGTSTSARVDCSLAATASPANIALHQLDSDHDGLSNYDEICIYNTNPNNADTDGDGYDDGAEVKGGYNPNGAGKLIK
ncbi:MAG: thrombospondin type 3 repeat-containing protein [Candidatus Falkowbacteria bacterium]